MEVLLLSGLPLDQIKCENIYCGRNKEEDIQLRTVTCGPGPFTNTGQKKPVLVLIHGYGGGGALFYKVIKSLTKYFHLILIDIIGMGASSRPDNYNANEFNP